MLHRRVRPDNKKKGVLLPVFSLPSKYGMGCFSREARDFIEWLADTGHEYWQILPLNPTAAGNSPYQTPSCFAGNPWFIDPQTLIGEGLLLEKEARRAAAGEPVRGPQSAPVRAPAAREYIDYEAVASGRKAMLRTAWRRFVKGGGLEREDYRDFCSENDDWLEDYALFTTLKSRFGDGETWESWPEEFRRRNPDELRRFARDNRALIDYHIWVQFEFFRQWKDLKTLANERGVKIIGDLPIYVSYDSADCWASPEQFQLDENHHMTRVAGVPPDAFTEDGQLWGNPLYDWGRMKEENYQWWVRRLDRAFQLFDVVRLDHFRGFEAYYSVDASAETAKEGVWEKGPGMDLFRRLNGASGRFVAEDLGFLTDEVQRLLEESGFPGTQVIQFAFDGDPANRYLPENYPENCVAYTGTHDNDTTLGWFRDLAPEAANGILQYLGWTKEEADRMMEEAGRMREASGSEGSGCFESPDPACRSSEDVPAPYDLQALGRLICKVLDSRADLVVIPLQDYLGFGSEARINVPGTASGNWRWRLKPGDLNRLV